MLCRYKRALYRPAFKAVKMDVCLNHEDYRFFFAVSLQLISYIAHVLAAVKRTTTWPNPVQRTPVQTLRLMERQPAFHFQLK